MKPLQGDNLAAIADPFSMADQVAVPAPVRVRRKSKADGEANKRGAHGFGLPGSEDNQQIDHIAVEAPVALIYNGISHAVMLATPADLEDFAVGFSLTEQIVPSTNHIRSVEVTEMGSGFQVDIDIAPQYFMQLKNRRRQLAGRTGCGLCGKESLDEFQDSLRSSVQDGRSDGLDIPDFEVIEKAMINMQAEQYLQNKTGGVHAACLIDRESGSVLALREDVGRHNALDKLLGAIQVKANYQKCSKSNGFVMVSSRASYEMVSKVASLGLDTLVAFSAPSSLAVDLAKQANINLLGFVRPGRQSIYHQVAKPLAASE